VTFVLALRTGECGAILGELEQNFYNMEGYSICYDQPMGRWRLCAPLHLQHAGDTALERRHRPRVQRGTANCFLDGNPVSGGSIAARQTCFTGQSNPARPAKEQAPAQATALSRRKPILTVPTIAPIGTGGLFFCPQNLHQRNKHVRKQAP